MIFEVRTTEYDSASWKKFEAADAEHAAERWAEWEDAHSAEYLIVSGRTEPTVEVRDPEGAITRWMLTGESVPRYRARSAPLERTTKP